ncbi:transcriptional regulator, AraC family with amidase-like domain [Rhizobiales bacterium GAS191]|nr:transcriptional regulator, AraC family with amidase-like domain [Rhizobiales bacterium GAS191]
MSGIAAHEIGIVHYPGAQVACILGLTDLFGVASTIALDQRRSDQSPLRVTHWKPIHCGAANLSCVYDSAPRGSPKPRTLIIPPTMVNLPDPEVPAGVVSWVRNRHAAGTTLVSLCSGAFILAETGLVDGLSVATHQICAEALAKRFPQIVVDTNRRIIDHGDIITAGGFLSWVDLGLFLVDRMFGPAMWAETARFVLSDPAAGKARYFTGFAPPQTHADRAVLKAQEWVHMRDGRGVSLAAMATAARLERRTLLRRFANATGMSPIEYCRAVRIARARELLEGGNASQKQIAQSLGYEDVASFARVFRKAVGSAPGAYRKRFGRNGVSPADFAAKDGSRQKKRIFEAGLQTG